MIVARLSLSLTLSVCAFVWSVRYIQFRSSTDPSRDCILVFASYEDSGSLRELWIDVSGTAHETGTTNESEWKAEYHCPAALWIERKAKDALEEADIAYEKGEAETAAELIEYVRIQGPAVFVYPRNDGWMTRGQTDRPDGKWRCLSDLTIKHITTLLSKAITDGERPNCEAAWAKRLGRDVINVMPAWSVIWNSLGSTLTDPTEEAVFFKTLHRAIFVRNRDDKLSPKDQQCRLCRREVA